MVNKIIEKVENLCSWLSFSLVILITVDVFLRYVFNFSSASLYELEWHFFAAIFLLGSAVTLQKDQHVRVDVFYNKLSKKKKEVINLIGNIFFFSSFLINNLLYINPICNRLICNHGVESRSRRFTI